MVFSISSSVSSLCAEQSVIAPLADRSLLLDGTRLENGRVVTVGERGHALFSDDQAVSWTQAQVPTRATLTAVSFYDQHLGWAVGHDAVILRTRDGGETWALVYSDPEEERPLLDVWCRDAQHCYAVGAYGYFLETRDAGDAWQSRSINEDDWHLNQLSASASGKLYIAAEAGTMYRSDDGGGHWETLPSPYDGSFFGILPLSGEAVLAFGLRGNLFRSDDAGNTWQKIKTGTDSLLTQGLALPDGRVLVLGLGGTVLISRDEGRSVTLYQQPDRLGISAAVPVADNKLAVFGEGGARFITIP